MIDWSAVGTALASLVVGVGTGITWWARRTARAAQVQAEAAQARTVAVVADAESQLYKLLAERLTTVEADVTRLTKELSEARQRERALEQHIFHLENLMRRAGMDVPERARMLG